jgi:N-acetylmuramoyl-L-alanine amidase
LPSVPSRSRNRRVAVPTAAVVVLSLAVAGCTGDGHRTGSSASPSATARPSGTPSASTPAAGPLAGRTVVIDPGHNPHNNRHIGEISRRVDIGTKKKRCDTTGTATNDGYPEAQFTLDVARRVRALLRSRGADVRLTQNGDRPWGPCIDERARIGNRAHADAVVSVHADGAPAGARGFHVILPASVHEGAADTRRIAGPSRRLGRALAADYRRATGFPYAAYAGGGDGLDVRGDLGGLNLSGVPKVFIECGNMRDPHDAAALTDPAWRARAARGVAQGITDFLTGEGRR